ncbi:MAG: YaiI/YqxD family protein [Proteobacteria bacterium]|nr:YaiI/YqxD family protein [Pseudomonadota bacterium]MBU1140657.1 YaiI/YqxD family protein [Pseudomonadota bacterium]MBU1233671.1 YaiI/YqxD family protein [Pseudomonadota bacterium]MBU1418175.1 YaiI/YqxD family protein [Pseudomonadota bacterium]MBU1454658.1 YaiI/YqxD family protein [Pseudomonadota bacterium]
MKIWVDADACPVVIKEILFKAAERTGVQMSLVANQPMRIPPSSCITFILVGAGSDVADNEIVKRLGAGDLVITADIPLAAAVIEKGGYALNPRGELYTTENIKSRLSMRDFMDSLRANGVETGGPPVLNQNDRQSFANQLDKFLAKYTNTKNIKSRKSSPPPW